MLLVEALDDGVFVALDQAIARAGGGIHPVARQGFRARVNHGAVGGRPADHRGMQMQGTFVKAGGAGRDRGAVVIDVGAHPHFRQAFNLMRLPGIGRAAARDHADGDAGLGETLPRLGDKFHRGGGRGIGHQSVKAQAGFFDLDREIKRLVDRDHAGPRVAAVEFHQHTDGRVGRPRRGGHGVGGQAGIHRHPQPGAAGQ